MMWDIPEKGRCWEKCTSIKYFLSSHFLSHVVVILKKYKGKCVHVLYHICISAHEIRSWRDDRKKCGCAATKWIMNQEKKSKEWMERMEKKNGIWEKVSEWWVNLAHFNGCFASLAGWYYHIS